MNLLQLRAAHPSLIRQDQTWWLTEAFALRKADWNIGSALVATADDLDFRVRPELTYRDHLPSAATLASLYVQDPSNTLWDHWLWCGDMDGKGQRVFVGKENGLLEIHRHIHLTDRFGVVVWR